MEPINLRFNGDCPELQVLAPAYRLLPSASTIVSGLFGSDAGVFFNKINALSSDPIRALYLDFSHDPLWLDDAALVWLVQEIEHTNKWSAVYALSGKFTHFFQAPPGVVWYPYWFLCPYVPHRNKHRVGRVSCLNRRAAPHRIALMFDLLDHGLVDHDRDVIGINLEPMYGEPQNTACMFFDRFIDLTARPRSTATIPDNFPNDHTVDHPAWSTALHIVTETECGPHALITEKTIKPLISNSCWMMYSGAEHTAVLEALGFARCFDQQATGADYQCIMDMCRDLYNFDTAMDYHRSRRDSIAHNLHHFVSGAWLNRYLATAGQHFLNT